jgi:ABC-type glycerol-3-phosphate transport system permease component
MAAPKLSKHSPLEHVLFYVATLLATGILGLPFFWMVMTSLKSTSELGVYPPAWLPDSLLWQNYVKAWLSAPFGTFYFNSIFTGVATTALQVLFGAFMAYAFACIRFPGKRVFLLLILATMMIPDEMKLVPNYLLLNKLGWIDTYWALIVPPIAAAFPVFVLYQQFRTIPHSLLEAARIDGASHFRTVWQVVLPVSRPALVAVTLVSFLGRWNDYLWPLVVTNSVSMRTLPIGLAYLKKEAEEGATPWNLMMAATIFVVIPILILYSILQKQFVAGITKGAVKG